MPLTSMSTLNFQQVDGTRAYETPFSSGYGWTGYILDSKKTPFPSEISGQDAFAKYNGHYIFSFSKPDLLSTDPEKFILDFKNFLDESQGQNFVGRAIVWLPDSTIPQTGDFDTYGIRFMTGGPTSPANKVVNNYNLLLGARFSFHISSGAYVNYDQPNQSLVFQQKNNHSIGFYDPPAGIDPGLSILGQNGGDPVVNLALSGTAAGSMVFKAKLEMKEAISYFGIGFNYMVKTGANVSDIYFPLVNDNALSSQTVSLACTLDPLDTVNKLMSKEEIIGGLFRTGFAFEQGQQMPVFFQTVDGHLTNFVAMGGFGENTQPVPYCGGLVFNETELVSSDFINGGKAPNYVLSPTGDFALQVNDQEEGAPQQRLLCGLFGTEWLEFTSYNSKIKQIENDRMRFVGLQPAYVPVFPFENASMLNPESGKITKVLEKNYTTSWANMINGGVNAIYYSSQPDGCPMYLGSPIQGNDTLLPPASLKMLVPQESGFYFPITPYAGFNSKPDISLIAFESEIIGAVRKAAIGNHTTPILQQLRNDRIAQRDRGLEQNNLQDTALKRATTPQGLLVDIADDGISYKKVTLARSPALKAGSFLDFSLIDPTVAMLDALQTNQLFLVAVNNAPLGGSGTGASFSNILNIANWTFLANVGKGAVLTNYRNVLIMKFCSGSLSDRVKNPNKWTSPAAFSLIEGTQESSAALAYTGLSQWLQNYFDKAKTKAATETGKDLYSNFVDLIEDPNWKGIIVLNADMPLDGLPGQLEGIAAGIDFSQFSAHHFGSTISHIEPVGGTLDIKGISTSFGLVDYQDAAYAIAVENGGDPDKPISKQTSGNYAFTVLQLQALFKQSSLSLFKSHIQLNTDQLFGSKVVSTFFKEENQGVNAMVLDGSAVKQNDTTTYIFEQKSPYRLTLNNNFLPQVFINQIQFNTLGTSGGDMTVASRFLIWGALNFAQLQNTKSAVFDVSSFGSESLEATTRTGLAISNLQINMAFPKFTPGDVNFAFVPDNIAFDLATSTVRDQSLFKGLSLQLKQFISVPESKTPADCGFLPVLPVGILMKPLTGHWYGVTYKVVMGSPGALVSAAGFESDLLVAWSADSPTSNSEPAMFVGLSLPGASPGASVFSIQGVIKLSTGPIKLLYQEVPGENGGESYKFFNLQLTDIGIKILGIAKLPPGATIQFFIFGDPKGKGSLGWYAAYKKDPGSKKLFYEETDGGTIEGDAIKVIPAQNEKELVQ